jgi:Polyketide cyclase / dehydrase and lipid transport
MSESRQQVWIDAPQDAIWNLIVDVDRHSEWWPRVLSVECEGLEPGCNYREVVQTPLGRDTFDLHVDKLEGPHEFMIRCVKSGTFFRLALTDAQGGTFLDGQAGMDPQAARYRFFDALVGKRFFQQWLRDTLDAINRLATERSPATPAK